MAQFAAQLTALDARVYTIASQRGSLALCRLHDLHDGLAKLATALARTSNGQVDASWDLFAVFGDVAEQAWLTRFREGRLG